MNEKSREDFLRLLARCDPKVRTTKMQTVEGRASQSGIVNVTEELSFLSPDNTTREVTLFSMRTCDCGKLLTQKNPLLLGACQHPGCTHFNCSECARTCTRCGRTFCPNHASSYVNGDVYCLRCRPFKWLKLFFDVGEKRGKE